MTYLASKRHAKSYQSDPIAYYLPKSAVKIPLTQSNAHSTFCEWKGRATYWDITLPKEDKSVSGKIWSYESPSSGFTPIKGLLSFYANAPWECFVNGEKVEPQPGDFYGGWVTSDIMGEWVKGRPGTRGW